MDAGFVGDLISDAVASTTGILTSGLPAVFTLVAGLIGLALLIRYIKKHVGRK